LKTAGGTGQANGVLAVDDSHVQKLISKAEREFEARSFGLGLGLLCAAVRPTSRPIGMEPLLTYALFARGLAGKLIGEYGF
jgi:hypothetical protein